MNLFKKQLRPEELGAMIYEMVRSAMEGSGDLSVEGLAGSIDRRPEDLDQNYRGEVVIGLMFAAGLAVERSAHPRTANMILGGMKSEFLNHLEEQGASILQRSEWEAVLSSRFLSYRNCLEDYSGFEPPWKLGREFFWNIIGEQLHVAMSVKIATLYLLEGQSIIQNLLNTHGPSLRIPQDT